MPIAGAPRIASSRIAAHSSATVVAAPVDALARQARLVEHDDGVVLEPDHVGGREHGATSPRPSACLSSAMRSISNGSTPAARAV